MTRVLFTLGQETKKEQTGEFCAGDKPLTNLVFLGSTLVLRLKTVTSTTSLSIRIFRLESFKNEDGPMSNNPFVHNKLGSEAEKR
jgi:hypothetical protein